MTPKSAQRFLLSGQYTELRCGLSSFSSSLNQNHFVTPQYALLYIVKGIGTYLDKFQNSYSLKPGSIVQRYPQQPHSIISAQSIAWYYLALPPQIWNLMKISGLPTIHHPVHHTGTPHPEIIARFQKLISELQNQPQHSLISTLTSLQTLAVELHLQAQATEKSSSLPRRLRKAITILEKNLNQRLALPDLACEIGMNYSTFRKEFARYFHLSPGDYRIKARIKKAQELIEKTSTSFQEIAEQLGYSDIYTFSTQFKKITGISPRQHRRLYQSTDS